MKRSPKQLEQDEKELAEKLYADQNETLEFLARTQGEIFGAKNQPAARRGTQNIPYDPESKAMFTRSNYGEPEELENIGLDAMLKHVGRTPALRTEEQFDKEAQKSIWKMSSEVEKEKLRKAIEAERADAAILGFEDKWAALADEKLNPGFYSAVHRAEDEEGNHDVPMMRRMRKEMPKLWYGKAVEDHAAWAKAAAAKAGERGAEAAANVRADREKVITRMKNAFKTEDQLAEEEWNASNDAMMQLGGELANKFDDRKIDLNEVHGYRNGEEDRIREATKARAAERRELAKKQGKAGRKMAAQIAATKIQRTKKAQELRRAEAERVRIAAELEAARIEAERQRQVEIARRADLIDDARLLEYQKTARETEEARLNAMSPEARKAEEKRREALSYEEKMDEDVERLKAEDIPHENKQFYWMGGVAFGVFGAMTLGGILIARRNKRKSEDDDEDGDDSDAQCSEYEYEALCKHQSKKQKRARKHSGSEFAESDCSDIEANRGDSDCDSDGDADSDDEEVADITKNIMSKNKRKRDAKGDADDATVTPRSSGRASNASTASAKSFRSELSGASANLAKKLRSAAYARSPVSVMKADLMDAELPH